MVRMGKKAEEVESDSGGENDSDIEEENSKTNENKRDFESQSS